MLPVYQWSTLPLLPFPMGCRRRLQSQLRAVCSSTTLPRPAVRGRGRKKLRDDVCSDMVISENLVCELAADGDHVGIWIELLKTLQTGGGSVVAKILRESTRRERGSVAVEGRQREDPEPPR